MDALVGSMVLQHMDAVVVSILVVDMRGCLRDVCSLQTCMYAIDV